MTTKFGLPTKVLHCKKCLMTNQKPFSINETKNSKNLKKIGLKFNNGICDACTYSTNKEKKINWQKREKLLLKLLEKYRKNDGSYDCLVPGSGGKDSIFASHILKHKYKMNPLTVTFSPIQYTQIGLQNLRNWIDVGGFDHILFSPNGKIVSILAKEAFKNLLHPMQPFKFGIKQYAAKEAVKNNIELIFYGEPYSEYGSEDNNTLSKPTYSSEWYTSENNKIYLGGKKLEYYKQKYNIKKNQLEAFLPLKKEQLKNKKLKVEYLGWYLKWDPQETYYYSVKNGGFSADTERVDGTHGRYSGLDDKFEWIHYYCQYIKFGIGRCRFETSQEIRNNHITREEGIALCKKFEGEFPKKYFQDCIDFMGLSKKEAHKIIDSFRPNHLWKKKNNEWIRLQELKDIS
jgi:N-acetyl sugar amidotransferase